MFKFVFNDKRIASREDNTPKPQYDVTTNVTSMEHEEVKKQNARERKENKAKGSMGNWLVLSEWEQNKDYSWSIVSVKSVRVDGKNIKEDQFYELKGGKFVKSE